MLSIITITFNNFEELKKTCESLPSHGNFEHIIVNGGSCSRTRKFLKLYSPPFKSFVISEPDSGIYDAFNKGVLKSNGEFIQFLNSGDILIAPRYLEESSNYLKEDSTVSFVHGSLIFIDSLVSKIEMKPGKRNIGRGLPYLHPTMVVRKKLFEEYGLFKKSYRFAADYEWVLKLYLGGEKGFFLPIFVVEMNGEGVSVNQEWGSIMECGTALLEQKVFRPIIWLGFIERILFFLLRKSLVLLKLSFFLKFLKNRKYKSQSESKI